MIFCPKKRLDAFIRELKGQILNYSNRLAVLGNVWRKKSEFKLVVNGS